MSTWRWIGRCCAILALVVLGVPGMLVAGIFARYADSSADVRRVFDSLTPEDMALPAGASTIFRVPLWRKGRDDIVDRLLVWRLHPNLRQSEWLMRGLCTKVLTPLRATEAERNALMWRELYFGYDGYGLKFAAQTYFKKAASELTEEEVVQLWTLAKSPNRFTSNPRDFERVATMDLDRWRAEAK